MKTNIGPNEATEEGDEDEDTGSYTSSSQGPGVEAESNKDDSPGLWERLFGGMSGDG